MMLSWNTSTRQLVLFASHVKKIGLPLSVISWIKIDDYCIRKQDAHRYLLPAGIKSVTTVFGSKHVAVQSRLDSIFVFIRRD